MNIDDFYRNYTNAALNLYEAVRNRSLHTETRLNFKIWACHQRGWLQNPHIVQIE